MGKGTTGLHAANNEVGIMRDLYHQNIINLIEVMETASKLYLILEFAERGAISNKIPMTESDAHKYCV